MSTSDIRMPFYRKHFATIFGVIAYMLFSGVACAAGVDTGSSSLTSLQTWMMTWIPLAATLLIIACAIGWMANMLQMTTALRLGAGLIVIGSASYLVGLFGLTT